MAKSKHGMVYLLKSTCGKYYKYGCSKNISQRLVSINVRNPFNCRFRMLISFGTDNPFGLENTLKWSFSREQVCSPHSEYFIGSESDLREDEIVFLMTKEWEAHDG